MNSGLGMLFDVLPWRSQKRISDTHSRIVHELMQTFVKIVDRIMKSMTGIRESWTGWNRLHEKVKNESLNNFRFNKVILFPSFFNRLIRWW